MQLANDVLQDAYRFHSSGDLANAELLYCRLIAHEETHPAAYHGLGTLYAQAGLPGRSIVMLKKAIELHPKDYTAMMNLGTVYRQLEKRDEAAHWLLQSLAIKETPQVLSNLAGMCINDARPKEAIYWADRALKLDPKSPDAMNHKALGHLELGEFAEGWKWYDGRMGLKGKWTPRPYKCPMWDGREVKRLALHGEQGLGDEILFLTLLPDVISRFPKTEIALECASRLVSLLQNSFPTVKVFPDHESLIKEFEPNAYLPLGSLPRIVKHGTSEQWAFPKTYLKPVSECKKEGKRVGLSWRGGLPQTHAVLRNTDVEHWKPLTTLADTISLQYGYAIEDAELLGIPHSPSIVDLDRLAAMIKSCDLVISVCNTTIHMAGALGIPCLVLVPSKPAWRYGLRGEMHWYQSVKLLRQAEGEPWPDVIARAKTKAEEMLKETR